MGSSNGYSPAEPKLVILSMFAGYSSACVQYGSELLNSHMVPVRRLVYVAATVMFAPDVGVVRYGVVSDGSPPPGRANSASSCCTSSIVVVQTSSGQ